MITRMPWKKIVLPSSLLLLLVGVSVFTLVSDKRSSMAKGFEGKPYTLIQQRTIQVPNKPPKIEAVITRVRSSSGEFIKKTDNGKKQDLAFSYNGRYYRLYDDGTDKHLTDLGAYSGLGFTEEGLQKTPTLRKDQPTEIVAGEKCYVIQHEDAETSLTQYVSPTLGIAIQTIRTLKAYGVTTTIKPTSLIFGEPDKKHFEGLPINLPVVGFDKPKK